MVVYIKHLSHKSWFLPAVLVLLTFITYFNILPNKLFFDDEELIYKNEFVKNFRDFPKYFTTNMIAGAGKVSNMYRPVLTLSFAVDYFLWKGNPFGFHLTSIFLHTLNSLLVFIFLYKLFKKKLWAFFSSLLFAIHPINSEAVIYASGRTDPLVFLWSISSILFFLKFSEKKRYQIWTYGISLLFFILALLSKETAVVLPLIILISLTIYTSKIAFNLIQAIKYLFPYFFIDGVYIYLRLTVLNFSNTLNFFTKPNIYSQNIMVRFSTFSSVFWEYLGLLIYPAELKIDRNSSIVTDFFNLKTISFIFLSCFLLFYIIKGWKKNKRLLAFATGWFFISLSPVSGIVPINNISAEHYLYFPSVAVFLLIGNIFYWLINKTKQQSSRIFIIFFLFIIYALLIGRTVMRTYDWRDPITFYTIGLKQSPNNIPMRNNLAMAYADQGKINLAITQYEDIIKRADIYPHTHHNLGNAYKDLGQYQQAEKEYYNALEIDPAFYFSYYALADLYQKTKEQDKLQHVINIIKTLPSIK